MQGSNYNYLQRVGAGGGGNGGKGVKHVATERTLTRGGGHAVQTCVPRAASAQLKLTGSVN